MKNKFKKFSLYFLIIIFGIIGLSFLLFMIPIVFYFLKIFFETITNPDGLKVFLIVFGIGLSIFFSPILIKWSIKKLKE